MNADGSWIIMSENKAAAEATEPRQRIIKRYPNRKLYDTEQSCYVTLDEIASMVKAGIDVRIIDNKTNEDITSVTLAQVLFEEEKKKKNLLGLNMFRKLIQEGQDLVQRSISEAQDQISQVRDETEKQLQKVFTRSDVKLEDMKGLVSEFLTTRQKNIETFQKSLDDRIRFWIDKIQADSPSGDDRQSIENEIKSLRHRLAELEDKLDKLR